MSWFVIGSWLGFAAVGLGAFGAHALRQVLSDQGRAIYQTAVMYHFVHSLALLATGWLSAVRPNGALLQAAGVGFSVGIILFSGSLYLLSLTGMRWLGMITPVGGIAFLIGWACLALAAGRV